MFVVKYKTFLRDFQELAALFSAPYPCLMHTGNCQGNGYVCFLYSFNTIYIIKRLLNGYNKCFPDASLSCSAVFRRQENIKLVRPRWFTPDGNLVLRNEV